MVILRNQLGPICSLKVGRKWVKKAIKRINLDSFTQKVAKNSDFYIQTRWIGSIK